jgi:2,3-bisphosphoglycerate-independent phosphoglycerate mutase
MSSDLILRPHPTWPGPAGPLVLAILDGVGVGRGDAADAVALARTPTLDRLLGARRFLALARARHRGRPAQSDDDMGNSEVGHNALGAGVVHAQGALLVGRALASGAMFDRRGLAAVHRALRAPRRHLHLLGLLSDGNVHSHQDHLEALLRGGRTRRAPALRPRPPRRPRRRADLGARPTSSASRRCWPSCAAPASTPASPRAAGGSMVTTMDRYEADWRIVERGWRAHVHGDARRFPARPPRSPPMRAEAPGIIDQDLPPFVIADDHGPVRADRRRRRGDAVQLPRRSRDRDRPRLRRRFAHRLRSRPLARRAATPA